uniref:Ionotropic glutamate receptor 13 n=1 Tax=Locusta migratoria TaxID=7004 RepID=A0A0M5K5N8_LOCMI|nr:ionotropic glutamate receptor 13 [Locusta migratoria]
MRQEGLSGDIVFDEEGRRVGFSLEVLELTATGFRRVALWTPEQRFVSSKTETQKLEEKHSILQGRHLIVSSRIGAPYLMEKQPTTPPRVGNDRYEGYSLDLITQISEILNFTFEFKLAPDGKYGAIDEKTGTWNGLVGELIAGFRDPRLSHIRDTLRLGFNTRNAIAYIQESDFKCSNVCIAYETMFQRADLAICDLTITQERQSAVDFTMPFMNLGISILYSKSEKADPNLFSFLDPFTVDVWIYMATAYLGVSLTFFALARLVILAALFQFYLKKQIYA